MNELNQILNKNKCVNIRIDIKKNMPLTISNGYLGVEKKSMTVNLADCIFPEDLPGLMGSIDEISAKETGSFSAECRFLPDSDKQYMICGELHKEKRMLKSETYLYGSIVDISEFSQEEDNDSELREFTNKMDKSSKSGIRFAEFFDREYLCNIQSLFVSNFGVNSAMFDENGEFVCSHDIAQTEFDISAYKFTRETEIRFNHTLSAKWLIAADEQGLIEECAAGHELITGTLSKIANAYILFFNETENSARANRMLSENVEQQMLMNNVYSLILKERNSMDTLRAVVKLTGEYMKLDRVVVYEDFPDIKRYKLRYEWVPKEENYSGLLHFSYSDYPKLNEELSDYETYFSNNPGHVVLGHEFTSYVASNLKGDGVKYGIIIYEINDPEHILTHPEKRMLRNVSQIIATVLMRCKDNEELDKTHEDMRQLAYNDPVLKVKNKTALKRDLADTLSAGNTGAVVAFKIINIKTLNHLMGHSYTDGLIRSVLEYIVSYGNYNAEPYRFSDNVFMILLRGINTVGVREFCEAFKTRFHQPWNNKDEGGEHYFEINAGVALFPESGTTTDELYRTATMSMYKAREYGANTYAFFAKEFELPTEEDYRYAQLLRNAIENGMEGLTVKYQPVFCSVERDVLACEAIAALVDEPSFPPSRIVHLAENMGLDISLDKWIFRQACEFCKKMRSEHNPDFTVSVNATARALSTRAIEAMVKNALDESGLPANALAVEFSENVIAANYNSFISVLGELRNLKVSVIIDNIGSHYSVPALIKHSGISSVKADVTVFTGVYDDFDKTHTNMLLQLARDCGVSVCVKEIQSEEQLEYINDADHYQGRLYAHPMDEEEFFGFIECHDERQAVNV